VKKWRVAFARRAERLLVWEGGRAARGSGHAPRADTRPVRCDAVGGQAAVAERGVARCVRRRPCARACPLRCGASARRARARARWVRARAARADACARQMQAPRSRRTCWGAALSPSDETSVAGASRVPSARRLPVARRAVPDARHWWQRLADDVHHAERVRRQAPAGAAAPAGGLVLDQRHALRH